MTLLLLTEQSWEGHGPHEALSSPAVKCRPLSLTLRCPGGGSGGGQGNHGGKKGANVVTTRTTFAPVTVSTSSGGAGGAPITLATGGSSRGPWQRPPGTPGL